MAGEADKTPPIEDPIKNVKAEFDRKQANIEAQLKEVTDVNKALLKRLELATKPPPADPPAPGKKLKDVWYDDEEAAANMIVDRAVDKATKSIGNDLRVAGEAQRKQQEVFTQLYMEYPELSDPGSQLYLKAVENYRAISDEDKSSPLAYRMAVKDAASEIGMKPRSKRGNDGDDGFTMGTGNRQGNPPRQRQGELDPKTLEFARMSGLDIEDPKVIERLKARAARNFNTWSEK